MDTSTHEHDRATEQRPWPAAGGPWSRVPRTTLLGYIAPLLAAGGDRPAVIFDDGRELSCRELRDRAQRLAGALSDQLHPGDRVVLSIGNRAEFLIAFLAILANRATYVALDPTIRVSDAAHVLADSGAVLAIAEVEPAQALRDAATAPGSALRDVLVVDGAEPAGLDGYAAGATPVELVAVAADPSDVADIGYTSGTTGLPKALAGDHTELLRYADVFLRVTSFTAGDRILCPLQFHYGDPLWLLLLSLQNAEPLIVMRRFSVSRFWGVAKRFGATWIMTIGSIPNLLLTAPPSPADRDHSVRAALAVAVPRDRHAELIERFGFAWLEMYGSSEAGPALAMPEAWAPAYVGTGALGVPVPEVDARLVDAEDGRVLADEAVGELELGGLVLFDGYLNSPEATAEVLHDGWLRTGDLMRRDGDGLFYFQGRRKELIRRGGENIAPAEVEAVLRLHPGVIDAAVVPVSDELRGEEVKAYVHVRPEAPPTPAQLIEFCAGHLARFKLPRYVELRERPFPRTPSQRIPKAQLMVDGIHRTTGAWDREVTR